MASDTFTLYKLIILKMLSRVTFPLSNVQICDYLLDRGYASYFDVQQSLNEMVSEDLIHVESKLNTSTYEMSEFGAESLDYFGSQIPDVILRDLEEYMHQNRYDLREAASVQTDYTQDPAGGYLVTLRLYEHNQILCEITMHADTEDEADLIADRFKRYHKDLYTELYKKLMIQSSDPEAL